MRKDKPTAPVDPTDVIGGIFTTRRDLVEGVELVLEGSGFTLEEADLLVSLYGARVLHWDDLHHNEDGFVTFSDMERFLVHSASMLSRRIRKLAGAKPPLLEIGQADRSLGQHFNAKRVRITSAGIKQIEPVWRRYQRLAAKLLDGMDQSALRTHLSVNQQIRQRIGERRSGLRSLLADDE